MTTRIYDKDLIEPIIKVEHPEGFVPHNGDLVEKTFMANRFMGKGYYKEIYFRGIRIGYGEISLCNDTLIKFDSDLEIVEMHFTLSGNTLTSSKDFEQDIRFRKNEHNLFYTNGCKGCSNWGISSSPMRIFEVNLLPSFFQEHLPQEKIFDLFREGIIHKKSSILSPHNFPITPQMMVVIHKIIQCDRKGHFKKMFLKSQVIELLMLQLEQITNNGRNIPPSLKKHDIEKLHEVRDILLHQTNKPCSLEGLAKQVGTNEFILKKGFKELFGTSVFAYWNELRMNQAMNMLVEEEMTVREVSEVIGYKNPQHFSTAFKRRYGFSPKTLKPFKH